MQTVQSIYVNCCGRSLHVTLWQPDGTPRGDVLAWHGLARTGRDMDDIANHLCQRGYRVVCPDTLGRGLSQWSSEPSREYCLDFYLRLATELIDQLQMQRLHWLGTSMGGALGMLAAGGIANAGVARRVRSLLLNDIGPQLAAAAVERIRTYAGQPPAFATVPELEAYFRQIYAPYGWLSDAQWRRLTETSTRRLPDGRVTPHYDPAMVQQFVHYPDDYTLWQHYDAIAVPVLCLRGERSDLLLPDTVAVMRSRGPGARGLLEVIEVPGCGHAPALNTEAHYAWIDALLDRAERTTA